MARTLEQLEKRKTFLPYSKSSWGWKGILAIEGKMQSLPDYILVTQGQIIHYTECTKMSLGIVVNVSLQELYVLILICNNNILREMGIGNI